ncbi:MAG TPA: ATP-binding cassette domain-containing protein [Thermoanaerobaculia bacterium]|nr:ATP-binding cassette domain-containing protein [Thermoanaerobaculia bacterium]
MVARLPKSQSRKLVVPEVIQSSAMDCGPAALKSLLGGYNLDVSYGRLREACQTDVDGTSIDSIETMARELGLEAEQIMIPRDHLLVAEARTLPAIVVTRLPNGSTHFVVAWRRHGQYLQVMDPAVGRRWVRAREFLDELYIHQFRVPAAGWREWAETDEFVGALVRRLDTLGLGREDGSQLVARALEDPTWRSIAALDAAVRMADALVRAGGIDRGSRVLGVIEAAQQGPESIPSVYWSVRPLAAAGSAVGDDGSGGGGTAVDLPADGAGAPGAGDAVHGAQPGATEGEVGRQPAAEEELTLVGALLVRVLGLGDAAGGATASGGEAGPSQRLTGVLGGDDARPGRRLLELLRQDGALVPAVLVAALAVAAGGVLLEALLLRSLLDVGLRLELTAQRLGAAAAIATLGLTLLLVELPATQGLLRIGRRLEMALRIAFLRKLPALGDRYFSSRLSSDMAERSHAIHQIRNVGPLAGQLVRTTFELVLVTAGLAWLDPRSAPWALLAALGSLAVPLASYRPLVERDLRLRSHAGSLSRFYLDGLLGLIPIRAHSAEEVVRREHETLVTEWSRAGLRLQRMVATVQGWQLLLGFSLVIVLVRSHLEHAASAGTVLLLVYWALSLPALGQELALVLARYPWYRNVTLRLLEPLGAREESATPRGLQVAGGAVARAVEDGPATAVTAGAVAAVGATPTGLAEDSESGTSAGSTHRGGVGIVLRGVSVQAGGHAILREVSLEIPPGEHVAIIGPSGAGKSSLVGVLLGWHRAAHGVVLIDGEALDEARLEVLRRETAWADPAVRLWNRSLVENIRYGGDGGLGTAIDGALLKEVLETLPDGMQTRLGEGGGLVSGGEGQRVRLARAMMRSEARLVILDEPFRGVDRGDRNLLLRRCRRLWADSTLLYITHDIRQTLSFDRVAMLDRGRLVESGRPEELVRAGASRYAAFLDADERARESLWTGARWRRLWLEGGRLREGGGA